MTDNQQFQFFKEGLQTDVKEYLDLDEQIDKLNKALKERKKKKTELSLEILDKMKQIDINYMNIKGGKLVYAVTKTKAPMNKTNITKSLGKYFNSDEKGLEVCKYLFENREQIEKVRLKRTKNRKNNTNN